MRNKGRAHRTTSKYNISSEVLSTHMIDRSWHKTEEIIHFLSRRIPPELAYRNYMKDLARERSRNGPAPTQLSRRNEEMLDREQMLYRARRRMAMNRLSGMVKEGLLERRGDELRYVRVKCSECGTNTHIDQGPLCAGCRAKPKLGVPWRWQEK